MTVHRINGVSVPEDFILYTWDRASFHAASLVRCGLYRWDEREDLRQELLVDLLQRLPRFNGSLGNPYAFAHSVIQNHARVIAVRGTKRIERAIPFGDLGSGVGWHEPRTEDFERSIRRIDVRMALDRLPAPLKRLALDLEFTSIPDACTRSGKSRSWVYQMLGEIRDSFIGHGLVAEGRRRRPRGKSKSS
jgi:DNA-directed RNA polymerase specialized sigma24 family protein